MRRVSRSDPSNPIHFLLRISFPARASRPVQTVQGALHLLREEQTGLSHRLRTRTDIGQIPVTSEV